MTTGEKIKKYRMLSGMTQKQLGDAVGFTPATADVRIAQYEKDKMVPKEKIRGEIAEALRIDPEVLSGPCILSDEDLMCIMLELEDELGIKAWREDGRTHIVLEDGKCSRQLISYLNFWCSWIPEEDKLRNGSFFSCVREYLREKEDQVREHYESVIGALPQHESFVRASEFSILLRRLAESGMLAGTESEASETGFSFKVSRLLAPPSQEAEQSFAEFMRELDRYSSRGGTVRVSTQMPDDSVTITYFVSDPAFETVKRQTDLVLAHQGTLECGNDYSRDLFKTEWQRSLAQDACLSM